ncbi:unnamed protein product [Didymodactylos carnosus]|uniref:Uncharacterized protein n=1 Tax=Didymodactylos carnosus TaxID=1234261 RepID=A0A815T3B7_9BILA|nr:unnamed protein product [Didymodactylos carnosus]CAF4360414.1 unnamed protein product [Didymodactylos carnosus]
MLGFMHATIPMPSASVLDVLISLGYLVAQRIIYSYILSLSAASNYEKDDEIYTDEEVYSRGLRDSSSPGPAGLFTGPGPRGLWDGPVELLIGPRSGFFENSLV